MSHKIDMSTRYKSSFSLILFDIDHFKSVNDTYGYPVGDEVLIKLAEKVRNLLRKSDKVARWGGEEFAVLLSNTGIKEAKLIAEDIRQHVSEIRFTQLDQVTASFGVVEHLNDEDEHEDALIKRVDDALYEAKSSGRNCVVFG